MAGAEWVALMPESTDRDPLPRWIRTVSPIEVNMKMIADHVVTLVSRLAAPTGAECGLRTPAAKGSGEISALTLLEKHDPNQDEANNNVNRTDQPDHDLLSLKSNGAEGGT